MLVNAGLANASPPVAHGGGYFQNMVPANAPWPYWVFHGVSQTRNSGLTFARGLSMRRIQINVIGDPAAQGADVIPLAAAVDFILHGYAGNLPDPDATFVSSCFNSDLMDPDGVDPNVRSYERKLQYEINFSQ